MLQHKSICRFVVLSGVRRVGKNVESVLAIYEMLYPIDAIVELCRDKQSKVTNAFLVTKQLDDFGIAKHETIVPIMRVPALVFLYFLGKAEAEGQNGKI